VSDHAGLVGAVEHQAQRGALGDPMEQTVASLYESRIEL